MKVPAGTGRIPARTYKICHGIYPNYPPAVGPGLAPVVPRGRGGSALRWRTPCAIPPHPGAQDGSTFDKLGLSPEPAHTAPNPQENSCHRPKTMLIKYEAKFSSPSNPSGCWIADSPLANFLGYWPKTAQARGPTPGNRAYQTCSCTPNRPQPLPGNVGKHHHPGLHRF